VTAEIEHFDVESVLRGDGVKRTLWRWSVESGLMEFLRRGQQTTAPQKGEQVRVVALDRPDTHRWTDEARKRKRNKVKKRKAVSER
jgi:hypothetical protein